MVAQAALFLSLIFVGKNIRYIPTTCIKAKTTSGIMRNVSLCVLFAYYLISSKIAHYLLQQKKAAMKRMTAFLYLL